MRIRNQQFEVEIIDEALYSISSADNVRTYSKEYVLADDYINPPQIGITVKNADGLESSCFVLGNAIGIPPHDHSAVVVGTNLFVALGNSILRFEMPSLILQWQKQVDTATSFGVYVSPDQKSLVSHGELEITKISFDGEILWSVSGKDIFTGSFEIFSDHIEVIDFNDEKYKITLAGGQISLC